MITSIQATLLIFAIAVLRSLCADPAPIAMTVGVGIPNVLELGMTLDEVRKNIPTLDVRSQTNNGSTTRYFASVPGRGISFSISNSIAPITLINVDVLPERTNSFHGSLDRLTFGPSQVGFGTVTNLFGSLSPFEREDVRHEEVVKRIATGQDFALKTSDGEMLYYVSRGVMFEVRFGKVVRFTLITKGASKEPHSP